METALDICLVETEQNCKKSTSGFDPRCPHFFEEDVVVIGHSVQPSTSGRSVEVARNALTSSMRYSEKNKR
ncbi:hypothetical protein NECAME_15417 [Necator americanus]|uniref:Uncharacterized protein n=1 Tax=Necator americanus TaxID=51031 RepID=W2SI74_NECAM|nr:hypothetical protein NECAME_15417 [Necator americanus]ETN69270.1 hypothetical protein NECAME_15417 [Necator americanus]